jgi:hypothetical protein
MAELSPQAQAVLSAWAKPVDVDRSLVINGRALEFQARGAIAAALRAAVACTRQHHGHDVWECDADELLAIAAELEGGND